MDAKSLTIERTFYLGNAGPPPGTPEALRLRMTWDLKPDETFESVEAEAFDLLYQIAKRERDRRYADKAASYQKSKSATQPDATKPANEVKPGLTIKERALQTRRA